MDSLPFCLKSRVQLGDHDLGPLLDSLKTPTDYVLAGKKSFSFFFKVCYDFFVVVRHLALHTLLHASVIKDWLLDKVYVIFWLDNFCFFFSGLCW